MTIDEHISRPCGVCGRGRVAHVGVAFGCPGGYGTSWSPDGAPDPRLIRPADPDPVVDGELPWTRADEEQMSAIADYAEGTIRGDA